MNETNASGQITLVQVTRLGETVLALGQDTMKVTARARSGSVEAGHVLQVPVGAAEATSLASRVQGAIRPSGDGTYPLNPRAGEASEGQDLRGQIAALGHLRYMEAQADWMLAQALEPGAEDDHALDVLGVGLEVLGDLYDHEDLIDETQMRLTLAARDRAQGSLSTARALTANALESRLGAYREKYRVPEAIPLP